MLLTIVLIAVERAIGLTTVTYGMSQQQYGYLRWSLTKQRVLGLMMFVSFAVLFLLLAIVALITSVPSAICNSIEVTRDGTTMDIPQDADTLITWLKFLFPLLSPVAILCWCSDISSCVKELVCCRSYDPPVIGQAVSGLRGAGVMPGVMTLIATADGLQLKLPNTTMNPLDLVDLPQPTAIPQQYEGVYTENERAAVPPRKEIKSIARSHLNKTGLNVSEVRHSEVHNEKGCGEKCNETLSYYDLVQNTYGTFIRQFHMKPPEGQAL
ncbi:unnamed protein product [Nippostrongylus brasiliensis]|uniref:Transmembrane protein n=1 Tax=Nippostrongylus brasiliensis TaxID=27835 RepID=A0A0N4YT96_NIPBR|nr:unnamed protein product [Nippostrongylus brasiliensis]